MGVVDDIYSLTMGGQEGAFFRFRRGTCTGRTDTCPWALPSLEKLAQDTELTSVPSLEEEGVERRDLDPRV